jgi:hypothetical protein
MNACRVRRAPNPVFNFSCHHETFHVFTTTLFSNNEIALLRSDAAVFLLSFFSQPPPRLAIV